MNTNLYANGCSMVFGSGLVDMTYEEEDSYNLKTVLTPNHKMRLKMAWPAWLATFLFFSTSQTVTNSASPGASMDRIVRTTLTDLGDLPSSLCEQTFAVIGLTEPQRFEFYEDDKWHKVVLPRGSFQELPRRLRKYAEDTAWFQHQDVPTYVRYLVNVLTLQSYFVSRGIKYLFVNSLDEYVLSAEAVTECRPLLDQIDLTKVMPGSMFELCKSKAKIETSGVRFDASIHPNVNGHRLWGWEVAKYARHIYPSLA